MAEKKYSEWCLANAPTWHVEEEEGRQLSEVLDKLLSLMVRRLDKEGMGVVTAKSFASKRSAANGR